MKRSQFLKLLEERIEYIHFLNPIGYDDYVGSEIWDEPDTDGSLLDPEEEWKDSAHRILTEELELLNELRDFYEDNPLGDQSELTEMGR